MEKFTVEGVVIKTGITGESDRIVCVLTSERGVIKAFANGARGTKNKLHAGSSLFTYGTFSFTEKNGIFTLNEVEIKNVFFDLRNELEGLALAQYFCEVLLQCVPHGNSEPEYLRLMLNSLHFLCKGNKPALLIKAVFELRVCCLAGYMPSLVACDGCAEYETPSMYFDCQTGLLFCKNCGAGKNLPEIPLSVISAMRYVVFSEFEKSFSFGLNPELLKKLNRLTELYLSNCFQEKFRTLDFFYSTR